jgi:hypothetical protein
MRQAFVQLTMQNFSYPLKKKSGFASQVQIAVEKFSEATIVYREDKQGLNPWAKVFTTSYFLVVVASILLKKNRGKTPASSLCINGCIWPFISYYTKELAFFLLSSVQL